MVIFVSAIKKDPLAWMMEIRTVSTSQREEKIILYRTGILAHPVHISLCVEQVNVRVQQVNISQCKCQLSCPKCSV
jgi:hypothetical protein